MMTKTLSLKIDPKEEWPISSKWEKHIVEKYRNDSLMVTRGTDIEEIVKKWYWTTKKFRFIIFDVINALDVRPASTVKRLIQTHFILEDIDETDLPKSEQRNLFDKYRQRFEKALTVLHDHGFIDIMFLNREEVGPGRREVSIYVSPFAEDHHIEKEKEWYLTRGGNWGIGKKRSQLTEKELREKARNHVWNDELRKQKLERLEGKNVSISGEKGKTYRCQKCKRERFISDNDIRRYEPYNKKYNLSPCNCGYTYKPVTKFGP